MNFELPLGFVERLFEAHFERYFGLKVELFVYKDADKVLESKGLLQEVKTILRSISKVDHGEIQELFRLWDWTLESYILKEATWRWDAYKDKVAVSVELSLIDAVHRDFQ